MRRIVMTIAVGALLLAACGAGGAGSDELPPVDDTIADPGAGENAIDPGDGIGDGGEGGGGAVVDPDLSTEVAFAMADLTVRIRGGGVVGVTAAHMVTWPDGSLGCPRPDMSYTQALVEGYRIELTDGTTTYDYHGAVGSDPFLCEAAIDGADPGDSAGKPDVVDLDALAAIAVADLAERIGVPEGEIVVSLAEQVTWRDGAHGCPVPGYSYIQALTTGTRFRLDVAGGEYWYHQGGDEAPRYCVDPQDPYGGLTDG